MNEFPNYKKKFDRPARGRAQSMVEFALVLPILLLVLVGLLEFGRLFYAWMVLENSTRFGIRYATAGTYNPAYCLDDTPCADDNKDQEILDARLPSIEDETKRLLVGFFYNEGLTFVDEEYLNITVCSDENDFNRPDMGGKALTDYASCDVDENAGGPNAQVFVAADYNFKFMVLPYLRFGGAGTDYIHLASYRSGVNEAFQVVEIVQAAQPPNPGGGIVSYTSTPTPYKNQHTNHYANPYANEHAHPVTHTDDDKYTYDHKYAYDHKHAHQHAYSHEHPCPFVFQYLC